MKQWADEHFERQSRKVLYRQGTKGDLGVRLWVKEVWTWEPQWNGGPRRRLLVVREDTDGGMKYGLSNLPRGLPWKRYVYVQAQRFWVEHAFHEAKASWVWRNIR